MALTTYFVEGIHVRKPGTKTAEANPDRWITVTGTFYTTKVNNGVIVPDQVLTILSKDVTFDMARNPGFVLDKANGILTLPQGDKGRKPSEDVSEDVLMAELEALRNPEPSADPVPDPVPEPEGKRSK